jgi:hypothetical protein
MTSNVETKNMKEKQERLQELDQDILQRIARCEAKFNSGNRKVRKKAQRSFAYIPPLIDEKKRLETELGIFDWENDKPNIHAYVEAKNMQLSELCALDNFDYDVLVKVVPNSLANLLQFSEEGFEAEFEGADVIDSSLVYLPDSGTRNKRFTYSEMQKLSDGSVIGYTTEVEEGQLPKELTEQAMQGYYDKEDELEIE